MRLAWNHFELCMHISSLILQSYDELVDQFPYSWIYVLYICYGHIPFGLFRGQNFRFFVFFVQTTRKKYTPRLSIKATPSSPEISLQNVRRFWNFAKKTSKTPQAVRKSTIWGKKSSKTFQKHFQTTFSSEYLPDILKENVGLGMYDILKKTFWTACEHLETGDNLDFWNLGKWRRFSAKGPNKIKILRPNLGLRK